MNMKQMTEKEWERKHAADILEGLSSKYISDPLKRLDTPPNETGILSQIQKEKIKNHRMRYGLPHPNYNSPGRLGLKEPQIVKQFVDYDLRTHEYIRVIHLSDGRIIKGKSDGLGPDMSQYNGYTGFAGTYAAEPMYEYKEPAEDGSSPFEQKLRKEVNEWCKGALD